jgi:hypothetical protein
MSYSFPCNWQAAVIVDPNKPHQIGYLTEFNGLGLAAPLVKDLDVQCPYNNATPPAYQGLGFNFPVNNEGSIVAAIQNVSWGGGVGDVFSFSCYMSQQNALQLKTLQNQTLRTTNISSIGWWVTNFDPQPKFGSRHFIPSLLRNRSRSLTSSATTRASKSTFCQCRSRQMSTITCTTFPSK